MDLNHEFENGTVGVYHLRGGEIGYTSAIPHDDGTFGVRYEDGWYCWYRNDGTREIAGVINNPDGSSTPVPGGVHRDIVKFERMEWNDAAAKYPGIRCGFPP